MKNNTITPSSKATAAMEFLSTWLEIKVLQVRRPIFKTTQFVLEKSGDEVLIGRSVQAGQMVKLIDELVTLKSIILTGKAKALDQALTKK